MPQEDSVSVDDLAEHLARIIAAGAGTRSRWALRAASDASETEGVAGMLVIKIPPKCSDHVEMSFTIGMVEAVMRWK